MLAVGLVVVGLAAAIYTGSVNREFAAIHARLDQHGAALARLQLPPGFELDP